MSSAHDYFLESLRSRVYEIARETALEYSKVLSQELGNHIWLKREDTQDIFSFKLRGAYNCIAHHVKGSGGKRIKRVVTASAGNHAQGVAMSASQLGLPSTILMPVTTPRIKIDSVTRLGGQVLLSGVNYDEAYRKAQELVDHRADRLFVHPYDDPWVISGQGTIALEIINQHPGDIEAVFVPVGGGGLLAGICACIKKLKPSIQIIAVEPEDADALHRSIRAGRRVKLRKVGLFADGVAVKQVGALTWKTIRQYVDQVVVVSTDEICHAIECLYNDTRSIAEPAGALSLAGLRRYLSDNPRVTGKHLISIVSGANINFNKLRYVSERAEYSTGEEKLLGITIPERPGSFKRLASLLKKTDITEFSYRHNDTQLARVFCGVRLARHQHSFNQLLSALDRSGYSVLDMTNDDLVKNHVRYTVGGRLSDSEHEYLIRMEFAERPGALLAFLQAIPAQWDISLFHYRNHGASTGQVLCGLRVPAGERRAPTVVLRRLGYEAVDETTNKAYILFLR